MVLVSNLQTQVTLTTDDGMSVTIDVSAGPRITSLVTPSGTELLVRLDPPLSAGPAGGHEVPLYGGHRLWVAPEIPELTYASDESTGDLMVEDRTAAARDHGTPIARTLHVVAGKSSVRVRHTITNTGPTPLVVAPWAITQMRPGGVAYLPVGRQSPDAHGLQASGLVAIWPYTRLDDPRLTFDHDIVRLMSIVDDTKRSPVKVGVDGAEAWLAYTLNGEALLVKTDERAADVSYVDHGAAVQSYMCDDFVELEALGPSSRLPAGGNQSLDLVWTSHLIAGGSRPADVVRSLARSTR